MNAQKKLEDRIASVSYILTPELLETLSPEEKEYVEEHAAEVRYLDHCYPDYFQGCSGICGAGLTPLEALEDALDQFDDDTFVILPEWCHDHLPNDELNKCIESYYYIQVKPVD